VLQVADLHVSIYNQTMSQHNHLISDLYCFSANRPRLVLGWVTTKEDRVHESVSVCWCGLESVSDRVYSRCRADMDVK